MVCFVVFFIFSCVLSLEACPDPVTVHIQNYDGPIILHSANCDNQQLRNHGNQNQYPQCETECTCVSKLNYSPYGYSGYPATSVGSSGSSPATNIGYNGCCSLTNVGSNGCCPVAAKVGSNGCCPVTNVGSTCCCPVDDIKPLIYSILGSGYVNNENCYNRCGNDNKNYQYKHSGCY